MFILVLSVASCKKKPEKSLPDMGGNWTMYLFDRYMSAGVEVIDTDTLSMHFNKNKTGFEGSGINDDFEWDVKRDGSMFNREFYIDINYCKALPITRFYITDCETNSQIWADRGSDYTQSGHSYSAKLLRY